MTRIGFNFTLRSRKIATTKYAIMRKEILDIVRVMVPLKKNAEIISFCISYFLDINVIFIILSVGILGFVRTLIYEKKKEAQA
jgi:hypothetical protein